MIHENIFKCKYLSLSYKIISLKQWTTLIEDMEINDYFKENIIYIYTSIYIVYGILYINDVSKNIL